MDWGEEGEGGGVRTDASGIIKSAIAPVRTPCPPCGKSPRSQLAMVRHSLSDFHTGDLGSADEAKLGVEVPPGFGQVKDMLVVGVVGDFGGHGWNEGLLRATRNAHLRQDLFWCGGLVGDSVDDLLEAERPRLAPLMLQPTQTCVTVRLVERQLPVFVHLLRLALEFPLLHSAIPHLAEALLHQRL